MGVIAVIRNHNLSYSVFARWREKLMKNDLSKQESISKNKARTEFKHIMEENSQLKRIIADQALELKRKDEVLKRINPSYSKR